MNGETAKRIGIVAAATQLALAVVLFAFSTAAREASSSGGPPEPIPRGLVLGLLFLLPAAIGGVGAIGGRPTFARLFVVSPADAILSFSGVTLIFLIPSVLFAYAAAKTTGPQRLLSEAALMTIIVVLGLGTAAALFGLTDARCWVAATTPSGVVYRVTPFGGGSARLSGNDSAGGCDTGLISLRGAALASVLGVGAIGLAGWSVLVRRRD